MKTEEILIIGGVGTALNIAEQINDAFHNYDHFQRTIGICIDSVSEGGSINNIPVVCNTANINEYLSKNKTYKVIFCLYRPDLLPERYELLKSLNIDKKRFTNFIHPTSYIASSVSLGVGNVVLSNSVIQSKVRIADFNIINSNICIEHESFLGTANFIAANVSIGANAHINDFNFIGLNSSVRENISLDRVFVGMHSLVLANYTNTKIYGIPARENEKGNIK